MKTLPYLKQITYAAIVVAFPFIFSASDGLKKPEVEQKPRKSYKFQVNSPEETLNILKITVDSLKNSTSKLSVEN